MKKWITLLSILTIVGGIVFFLLKEKNEKKIEVVKGEVTKGELSLKVSARGKIEARDRFELKAKIPGVIMFDDPAKSQSFITVRNEATKQSRLQTMGYRLFRFTRNDKK